MISWRKSLFALTALGCAMPLSGEGQPAPLLQWERLPSIPDPIGFAGSFAGVSNGVLIVAGGANFPNKAPWEGGTKVWHDKIFALEKGSAAWKEIGRLPEANGYGVSLSTDRGVILIGGGDAKQNFRSVWCATWNGAALDFTSWPDLPKPLAMLAAAQVGNHLYAAGGMDRPDATAAQKIFLVLDLSNPTAGWRELDYLPGPERFFATAGSDGQSFYLIGGARLVPDAQGKPQREWLRDAWRYAPDQGWTRLADLPRATVAAPTPAVWVQGRLLVPGGDDGTQLTTPRGDHRGFPRNVLAYNPKTDLWTGAIEMPFSLVTTTAVSAAGKWVILGGEVRPGMRSTEVWCTNLP